MLFLVKTCKTFNLSNNLHWTTIKTRVEGVKFIDKRRAVMVFNASGGKRTTLLGCNHFSIVKTCSLYKLGSGHEGGGDEVLQDEPEILGLLMKASGLSKVCIQSSSHDFSVFQVDTDVNVDVFRLDQLARRGCFGFGFGVNAEGEAGHEKPCVVMDLELHNALLITHGKVIWSISDTVPQKILASVSGVGLSEGRRLVKRSREKMGLF